MTADEILPILIKKEVVAQVGSRDSFKLATDLFDRWLIDLGVTFKTFQQCKHLSATQPSLAPDLGSEMTVVTKKSTVKPDKTKMAVKKIGEMDYVVPKLGTLKNFRTSDKPVARKMLIPILTEMMGYDPDLEKLIALNANADSEALQSKAGEAFRGFWYEYHHTTQAGLPKVAKGIFCIVSNQEAYYSIYEPSSGKGPVVRYKGTVEYEIESIVFRVTSLEANLKETMMFRYSYNLEDRAKPQELKGVACGLNFERKPMASRSVIGRISTKTVPSSSRQIPHGHEFASDVYALSVLKMHQCCFEYGPHYSRIHDKQPNHSLEEDIRSIGKEETVDMITTYSRDYHEFEGVLRRLSEDKTRLYKFRCLFLDPDSGAFKIRFALLGVSPDELKDQVKRFKRFANKGSDETGVSFEIKYTPFWPMGIGCRVGTQVLYFGPIFATRDALTSPIFEFRDSDGNAAQAFAADFDSLWESASTSPVGDEPLKEMGIVLGDKER